MLDSKMILSALSAIDDQFIEESRHALKYGRDTQVAHISKAWKIAIIAAVIACLMAVTAFAAGWFGLSARISSSAHEVETTSGSKTRNYFSMNGYADSPEAKAHSEWMDFWWDYAFSIELSNEPDFSWTKNELEEKYSIIYAAYDRVMMDKLLQIQEKYQIRLHTEQVGVPTEELFYKISGVEPFIAADDFHFGSKALYEDGSFSGEGHVFIDGVECSFSVIRGAQGVLDPSFNSVLNAEVYTEWQYTNKFGDTVNLAGNFIETNSDTQGIYMFAEQGDYIVTFLGSCPNREDMKASAESFADLFDIEALCAGSADVKQLLDTKPNSVKPKEGLLTLKEFVETPEYKAAAEFYEFYSNYCDELHIFEHYVDNYCDYHYYGSFPSGTKELDAEVERIVNEYQLVAPSKALCYRGSTEWSSDDFRIGPMNRDAEPIREISDEEYHKTMGFGQISKNATPWNMQKYDNGSIWLQETAGKCGYYHLHYIPKGSFYPLLMSFHSTDVTSWAYQTECGEQVWISTGEKPPYPKYAQSSILYETDIAYVLITIEDGRHESYRLEMVADNIDFTMFN